MIIVHSSQRVLFKYVPANVSSLILGGSIRVTTLMACRKAENQWARDAGEGTKTTTSLPGRDFPNALGLAKLLGVDPGAIGGSGQNAVVTDGSNAVHRTERIEHAFLFCASALENDSFMKGRFGDGCVKIKDPVAFFELIDQELRRAVAPRALGQCVVDDVEYATRTNNYRDQTSKHCAFIKPRGGESNFERELEVRAVWGPQGFTIVPVFLRIPDVKEMLELL
jgi:hypothetical protein